MCCAVAAKNSRPLACCRSRVRSALIHRNGLGDAFRANSNWHRSIELSEATRELSCALTRNAFVVAFHIGLITRPVVTRGIDVRGIWQFGSHTGVCRYAISPRTSPTEIGGRNQRDSRLPGRQWRRSCPPRFDSQSYTPNRCRSPEHTHSRGWPSTIPGPTEVRSSAISILAERRLLRRLARDSST